MSRNLLLAIDVGSSSCRSVLVSPEGVIVSEGRRAVEWKYPQRNWVEMDPVELWRQTRSAIADSISGFDPKDIIGVGITSHRETAVMWDRSTGVPVHNAVVWISQQTNEIVKRWDRENIAPIFSKKTGLRNDSFFSAAKVVWLLENVPGLRSRAQAGEIAFGTIDSWILWNLTGGKVHATDPSCASRTALLNLETCQWDEEIAELLHIPFSIFPKLSPSDGDFGKVDSSIISSQPPIRAIIADQQAGMFGQGCTTNGSMKNTFGTAAVLTINTGSEPLPVPGLTASVGWSVQGKTVYEAEGVVFHSGQSLSWLKESMGISFSSDNVDEIIQSVASSGGVYMVPAFGGMCAPHWNRDARASITGISLETNQAHIIRSAVEAMVYQTVDILQLPDVKALKTTTLKVDGGGSRSEWLCQFLADIGNIEVVRPRELERTSLGCAFVAGIALGIWKDHEDAASTWSIDRSFQPRMLQEERESLYSGWQRALNQVVST